MRVRDMLWRLKRYVKLLLAYRSATAYLTVRTTDWDLCMRDWPTWHYPWGTGPEVKCVDGVNRRFTHHVAVKTHYLCHAYVFFDSGSGIGHTPMEAARRAIRHMSARTARRVREHPPPTLKEMAEAMERSTGT